MDDVHRPGLVGRDSVTAILPKLGLHPPLRGFVAQLQAQRIVNAMGLLDVDPPALALKHDVDAPIAVAHPRLTDLPDPGVKTGLLGAAGLVVIGGGVDLENPAGPPDRHPQSLHAPSTSSRLGAGLRAFGG